MSTERQRELARLRQRRRRARYVRIDFYPDEDVLEIIHSQLTRWGPTACRPGVINHIIREWAGARDKRDRSLVKPCVYIATTPSSRR
jgi:hypothetical protein